MAGSYVSPLSISDPTQGNPILPSWGDAVNAALDYFDTLISDAAWTAHTPTIAQGVTNNISKTVNYSKYVKMGKTCIWNCRLAVTGAGTAGSLITLTLPFTAAQGGGNDIMPGVFIVFDASANIPIVGVAPISTTVVSGLRDASAGNFGFGVTPNFALASGDFIWCSIKYETT